MALQKDIADAERAAVLAKEAELAEAKEAAARKQKELEQQRYIVREVGIVATAAIKSAKEAMAQALAAQKALQSMRNSRDSLAAVIEDVRSALGGDAAEAPDARLSWLLTEKLNNMREAAELAQADSKKLELRAAAAETKVADMLSVLDMAKQRIHMSDDALENAQDGLRRQRDECEEAQRQLNTINSAIQSMSRDRQENLDEQEELEETVMKLQSELDMTLKAIDNAVTKRDITSTTQAKRKAALKSAPPGPAKIAEVKAPATNVVKADA